jgi:hypothetical protein
MTISGERLAWRDFVALDRTARGYERDSDGTTWRTG